MVDGVFSVDLARYKCHLLHPILDPSSRSNHLQSIKVTCINNNQCIWFIRYKCFWQMWGKNWRRKLHHPLVFAAKNERISLSGLEFGNFGRFCRHLVTNSSRPRPPVPLLRVFCACRLYRGNWNFRPQLKWTKMLQSWRCSARWGIQEDFWRRRSFLKENVHSTMCAIARIQLLHYDFG